MAEGEPVAHARNLEDIQTHVERNFGSIESVLHEVSSDQMHLDVLYVAATKKRPYALLVTSGASDLPMNVPDGMESFAHAEYVIALPKSWKISNNAFRKEKHYWPIRWLKQIGRLPHNHNTWIGDGHTIPAGDVDDTIANTKFVGVMTSTPDWLGEDFSKLTASTGELIRFYELVPLYSEEMAFKLENGSGELRRLFSKVGVSSIIDIRRPNVASAGR